MLCGNIINDIGIIDLSNLKYGVDYQYDADRYKVKIPLYKKEFGKDFYSYVKMTPNIKFPSIGRYFDYINRQVVDIVFDIPKINNPPFVVGWDYCLNYSSISSVTMNIISKIKDLSKRKSPLYVATFLAANIDKNNSEFGVIEGNWKETNFKPEECPSRWRDSGQILRKYFNDKQAVKYGQCWVLAELLTGMLQFLGIQSRSVKIHNCHIDLHDASGIDELQSDLYKVKNPETLNISELINNEEFEYQNNDFYRDYLTEKGFIYHDRLIEVPTKDDLLCLNYMIRSGKSWNFHVWTEFYASKKWWVVDPSPIEGYTDKYNILHSYLEFRGKKFFGPVEINAIKHNSGDTNGFRYLYSAVNGPIRYWDVLVKNNEPFFYLKNILYNIPQVVSKNDKGTYDKTYDYRCRDSETPDSYDYLHKNNPVILMMENNNFKLIKRSFDSSEYMIQVCLFFDKVLLSCFRKKVKNLNNLDIKDLRLNDKRANKLTVVFFNLFTKKWFSQMIKF